MKILLLVHSFNSLSQRLFVELRENGHEVSVEFDINDQTSIEAIELFQPELIIAPFLKRAIPEEIWHNTTCLIVHPGPPGDRGPSALDWAILNGEKEWGVTVLEANDIMDGGDIWASQTFPMRTASKGSIYRQEVTDAAVSATLQAVEYFISGNFQPQPQNQFVENFNMGPHQLMTQQDRSINWGKDSQELVLRKMNSADGFPGVLDDLCGRELFQYDAHPENVLSGEPGSIIAYSGDAICRATSDGKAVWIGHLRDKKSSHPFKLPATTVLSEIINTIPRSDTGGSYREISYREVDGVGILSFPFYNGAMGQEKCRELRTAYREAKTRDTRAIILLGGEDYWSNGMDLNRIEAADSPADESWENINAMDDLALEIMQTERQITISALQGNAGAGGVFLARAADLLWARTGVVLNPHYKDMGNLYGSEYWSYLLPRYAGTNNADSIMSQRLPMGVREANRLGLVDNLYGNDRDQFVEETITRALKIINHDDFNRQLEEKNARREKDETIRPLASYREEELDKMRLNFYGFDPSYHIARYNFIHKVHKSRTPVTLAIHRRVNPGIKPDG